MIEVAVYKGEKKLACGTLEECANELGVKKETVYYYLKPAHRRRVDQYKSPQNARMAVRLNDNDDAQQGSKEAE